MRLLERILLGALITTATLYAEHLAMAALVNHWEQRRAQRILKGRRNG